MKIGFKGSCLSAFVLVLISACGGSSDAPDQAVSAPSAAETKPQQAVDAAPTPNPTASQSIEKEPSPQFADLPEPYRSADYSRGRRVFRTCSSCHMIDPDAGNLVGPNLHGMFDRKVAARDDFKYSAALQEADFQWTAEQLDEWLANPRSFLPGNNMSFTGVRREKDRAAVIAYLLVETAE